MTRIRIDNGFIYTATDNPVYLEKGWLLVENGRFSQIGSADDLKPSADEVIDAGDKLILPGLINPHWHESFIAPNNERADDTGLCPTAYAKGGDIEALGALFGFISQVGKRLTHQESVAIARWSLWTQLRSGTTAIGDVGSANSGFGLAQAALDLGMRIRVSRWGADIRIPNQQKQYSVIADYQEQIDDCHALIEAFHDHASGRVGVMPSVMGAFAASDQLLSGMGGLAERYQLPFATHLAPLKNEREAVDRVFGCSPVERFARMGFLNDRLLAVHTAYASEAEYKQLLDSQVNICHSPAHYGMLGEKTLSDTGQLGRFIRDGACVSCSTDGDISFIGGMPEAMRACHLGHNEALNDNTACPPVTTLLTATLHGAKALGWQDTIGAIRPGMSADLILVDMDDFRYRIGRHPLRTFLVAGGCRDVSSVMVEGQWVVKERKSPFFDEAELWDDYCSAVVSARKRIRPDEDA